MRELLGYQGKTVVITGAFSGMGEAAARSLCEHGAEVHALDIKPVDLPVKQFIEADLSSQESIDSAVAKIPGEIDCLFNCAGLPGPPFSNLDTMLVNFVGLRHLTEALLPRIRRGGSVSSITSIAGMGWKPNLEAVKDLVSQPDFAAGRAWCEANPDKANGYLMSKQCIIYYTKIKAGELAKREVRINCLSPAPTDTPMLPAFHAAASKEFLEDHFLAPIGRNATPAEMGDPLLFLGSDMARFVSGVNLFVDYGFVAEIEAEQRPNMLGGLV